MLIIVRVSSEGSSQKVDRWKMWPLSSLKINNFPFPDTLIVNAFREKSYVI